MNTGCSHDLIGGHRQLGGIEQERPRLWPSETSVERDQLLERASLLELRVIEAADHDVCHVLEPVRAEQM